MQMGHLADLGLEGLQLGQHLQPVLGCMLRKFCSDLLSSPFLGDLGRDLQLANVVHQAGQPGLFDFNGVHAELAGHQHGDEGHVQAVLQQDVGMRAANEVQTERTFVGTDAGGGVAYYLRRVGEPFVRLEVECPSASRSSDMDWPKALSAARRERRKAFSSNGQGRSPPALR